MRVGTMGQSYVRSSIIISSIKKRETDPHIILLLKMADPNYFN